MADDTKTFNPILGKVIRATRVDECGNVPDPGEEDALAVTDGFIEVSLSPESEDSNEITRTRADGKVLVDGKTPPTFKYLTVDVEFTEVKPGFLELISNVKQYKDANGDVIGIAQAEGSIKNKFALELWSGLSGEACPDDKNIEEMSGYLLLPFLNGGTLDDLAFNGEDSVSFKITGAYTESGNAWGVGPYKVLLGEDNDGDREPDVLPEELDPKDHFLMIQTGVKPPEPEDGLQDMPEEDDEDGDDGSGED